MSHPGSRGRPMPVFHAGRCPDNVARFDNDLFTAYLLHPTGTRRDYQGLAFWVGMPCRSCSGLESDCAC